jgi:hypothetical protein
MSFRLFIYYCAMCGAWAAFAGWYLGRAVAGKHPIAEAGVKGWCLGLVVASGLGLVDALWNVPWSQVGRIVLRALVAGLVGSFGGLCGGVLGQALYGWLTLGVFLILGWMVTGFLIGLSLGVFDFLAGLIGQEDVRGAVRKIVNGVVGGTLGGLAGGALSLALKGVWGGVFSDKPIEDLWSPSATGFVALGLCIGFLIGLAQVILKEAWLRVEAGFRAGRELILSKAVTTIGRAEVCDVGLFGDPTIERLHARIVLQGNQYLIADVGTPGGTFLNGERISQPMPLHSGDVIRVGKSELRFGERQKRTASWQ